jgi:WD40 repeat protein
MALSAGEAARVGGPLVFISYSHKDRDWLNPFLVMLKPLAGKGVQVWADNSIEAGDTWSDEIDEAIKRAVAALLLVSPDFLASPFIVERELPALAERRATLVPVLVRPCLWKEVPRLVEVEWAHDPDMDGPLAKARGARREARIASVCERVDGAVAKRVSSASAPPRPRAPGEVDPGGGRDGRAEPLVGVSPGRLDGVPDLPPGFVALPEVDQVVDALLSAGSGAVGVAGDRRSLGLFGQGGVGKSVLAAAVARHAQARAAFPDGVFWVTLGEHANLLSAQLDLLARLGVAGITDCSFGEARDILARTLAEKRALLVVDDVWSEAAAVAFEPGGPWSRVLYTTRDADTLGPVRASVQELGRLPDMAARQLLAALSGTPLDRLPGSVEEVLVATGRVALALALVAATVKSGASWDQVAAELAEAGQVFGDHPYAEAFKALGVATARLSPPARAAYLSLAVFPRDTRVATRAVARYWERVLGSSADETSAQLGALAERGLLVFDRDGFSFHDLQHDYLLLQVDSLALGHADLLSCYQRLLGDRGWWELPVDEPYIADHLVYHLVGAGERSALVATLTDAAYLAVRIVGEGVHAAESDVRLAATALPNDERLDGLRQWLAQNGHLFSGFDTPGALAPTLFGRLGPPAPTLSVDGLRALNPSPYLWVRWGLSAPPPGLVRALRGHPGGMTPLLFSDGRLVASAGQVEVLAFSPDGRLLASAGRDWMVRLWDPASGAQPARLIGRHEWIPQALAFSPDGQLLASADASGTVRLWDVASGVQRDVLTGFGRGTMAFSADGRLLASSGSGGDEQVTVWVWDMASEVQRASLSGGHKGEYGVWALAFSPEGRLLASGGLDGVRLWDVINGTLRASLGGYGDSASTLAFSPDGRLLACGGVHEVRIWDPAKVAERFRLETGHEGSVKALAFSPDGRILASADNRLVRLWDLAGGAERSKRSGPPDVPAGMSTQPSEPSWLARVGKRLPLMRRVRTVSSPFGVFDDESVDALAFSPDGRLLASAGARGSVRLWAPASAIGPGSPSSGSGWVQALAFSPDGRVLASAGPQGVRLWDSASGDERANLSVPASFGAKAFSPDLQLLAFAADDETVQLWDLASGAQRASLRFQGDLARALAFSPDGRLLASVDHHTVRWWDLASGAEQAIPSGSYMLPAPIAFSADGRLLALADYRGWVELWDVASGGKWASLRGQSESVHALAFSPDGRLLASAGRDETVRLWDPASRAERVGLSLQGDLVRALAFSPDGRLLASAGDDGTVRLWDPFSGQNKGSIRLDGDITTLAWDGSKIGVGLARQVVLLTVE